MLPMNKLLKASAIFAIIFPWIVNFIWSFGRSIFELTKVKPGTYFPFSKVYSVKAILTWIETEEIFASTDPLATKIDSLYLKSPEVNEAPISLTDKIIEFVLASVLI